MKSSISFWVLVNFFSVLGYDGYSTCTKPFRGGKRLDVPCDFTTQTWCTIPGSYYPWRAVRRFVYENHGLMRRMYGDERHISVLRSEIESNDVDYQSEKWSHESSFKYKPSKTEYRSSMRTGRPPSSSPPTSTTTTPSTTTTTATTATSTTTTTTKTTTTPSPRHASTATLSSSYLPTNNTLPSFEGQGETTTDSATDTEFVTTDTDFGTTTEQLFSTTPRTEPNSGPQIFQDTLEKAGTTTEKAQSYFKSKGVNACPVKEEVVAPFWANNTRGEVLALLNLYPFEQYVHWERCTYENKQMFCREGCRCEQQYRLHRLLAYDPSNDCRGIFSDWFKFPSCCVCRCYDLPSELRLTSRSPRKDDPENIEN